MIRYHASVYVGHDGESPSKNGAEFTADVLDYDEEGIEAENPDAALDQVEARIRGELGRALEIESGTELGIELHVDGETIDWADDGVRLITL